MRPALLRGLVLVALVAGSPVALPYVSTMFRHSITNSARRAMSTATTANASSVGATTISSMPLSMAQALLNQTATTLHTKIDRGQNLDPALATDGAGFTTPVTPC